MDSLTFFLLHYHKFAPNAILFTISANLNLHPKDPLVQFTATLLTADEILEKENNSYASKAAFCYMLQTAANIAVAYEIDKKYPSVQRLIEERNIPTYYDSEKCGIAHATNMYDLLVSRKGIFHDDKAQKEVNLVLEDIIKDKKKILQSIEQARITHGVNHSKQDQEEQEEISLDTGLKENQQKKLTKKQQSGEDIESILAQGYNELKSKISKKNTPEEKIDFLKKIFHLSPSLVREFFENSRNSLVKIDDFVLKILKESHTKKCSAKDLIEDLYFVKPDLHKSLAVIEYMIQSPNNQILLALLEKMGDTNSIVDFLFKTDGSNNYFLELIFIKPQSGKQNNKKEKDILEFLQNKDFFKNQNFLGKAKDLIFSLLSKGHEEGAKKLLELVELDSINNDLRLEFIHFLKDKELAKFLARKYIDDIVKNIDEFSYRDLDYMKEVFSFDQNYVKDKINEKIKNDAQKKEKQSFSSIVDELLLVYAYIAAFGESEEISKVKYIQQESQNQKLVEIFIKLFEEPNIEFFKFYQDSGYNSILASSEHRSLILFFSHYMEYCIRKKKAFPIKGNEEFIDYLYSQPFDSGIDLLIGAAAANNQELFDYLVKKYNIDINKLKYKNEKSEEQNFVQSLFKATGLFNSVVDFVKNNKLDFNQKIIHEIQENYPVNVTCLQSLLFNLFNQKDCKSSERKDILDKILPLTDIDTWFKKFEGEKIGEIQNLFGGIFAILYSNFTISDEDMKNLVSSLSKSNKLDWGANFLCEKEQSFSLFKYSVTKSRFFEDIIGFRCNQMKDFLREVYNEEVKTPLSPAYLFQNELMDKLYKAIDSEDRELIKDILTQSIFISKKAESKIKEKGFADLLFPELRIANQELDFNKLIKLFQEEEGLQKKLEIMDPIRKLIERDDVKIVNFREDFTTLLEEILIENLENMLVPSEHHSELTVSGDVHNSEE